MGSKQQRNICHLAVGKTNITKLHLESRFSLAAVLYGIDIKSLETVNNIQNINIVVNGYLPCEDMKVS